MKDQKVVSVTKYLANIDNKLVTKSEFELKDIVALKSHPYQREYTEPKIGAYYKFTPALMLVIEVLTKSSYNTSTGNKDSNQYKCLFFSTKEGKFEKLWFKGEELKFIGNFKEEWNNMSTKSFAEVRKSVVGKEVILQTVDLELGKQKTFQDNLDGNSKEKISTLLDFLPPIASITDVKYDEGHTKYNEKNGKLAGKKLPIEAKIKWLNNESGKINEDSVPLECLKFVTFNDIPMLYESKKTYFYELRDPLALEDNPKLHCIAYPLYLQSVTFKHYYYTFNTANLFSRKKRTFLHDIPVSSYLDLDKMFKDGTDFGNQVSIQSYFLKQDADVFLGKWFKVFYKDRSENITERIIYVLSFESHNDPSDVSFKGTLRCNCLLRDGAIRNLRVEGIQKCLELPADFEKLFFVRA